MVRVYCVNASMPGEFGVTRWFSTKRKSFDFACSLVPEYPEGQIRVCSFPLDVDPDPSMLIELNKEFRTYFLSNRISVNL